jgi:glutaredoxin 3
MSLFGGAAETQNNSADNPDVVVLHAPCLLEGKDCGGKEFDASADSSIVADAVRGKRVVLFSKSYCRYCDATKKLLQENGIPYHYVELDQLERGPEVQRALLRYTGQRTVPSVFVGGTHVGGNSDAYEKWESGELAELLQEHGIKFESG